MAHSEVILTANIPNLGAEADIVKVRRGYARNFLLPQGKALEVTKSSLRQINHLKAKRAEREARKNGMDLIGIFHSHPDCDAYFSKTDLENSCPWYSFVVLSIQKGQFHHANSWLPNMEQTEAAKEELEYPNA